MGSENRSVGNAREDHLIPDCSIEIDRKLIEEGTAQLTSEIRVLESWLKELDGADVSDSEVVTARKSYNDMLHSRREMLRTLTRQATIQAIAD